MIALLLYTAVLALVVTLSFKRYLKVRVIERIPGPPALPILGNAIDLTGSHTRLFQTLNRFCQYGDGVSRIYLGMQPYVLLHKARAVEALLGSNSILDKSADYDFLHPWLGTGLLTSTGSKWRSRRKLLTPAFHFKILEDFVDVFNRQSERLVEKLEPMADGREFDVFQYVTLCTLDIIMETAMGTDINVQSDRESDYVKAVYGIGELVQSRQAQPWIHSDIAFSLLGYEKRQKDFLNILHDTSLSAIRKRKAEYFQIKAKTGGQVEEQEVLGIKRRLAFLDLLLEASESSTAPLSNEDLREEVDTFMFEGHDTTAAAINFTLYQLGRHPEIQECIYKEVTEVAGSGPIGMDQLREMKQLEACVKETLRLCPSVPFIGRRLKQATRIDGYDVPAGTTIMAMIYSLHRDPDQFPDPEKFDPDRFLSPDLVSSRHPYAYVPFSAGPRNCIGQKFALMEEKIVLASVIRSYRITTQQKFVDLALTGELILRPENGVLVSLSKRE